MTRASCPCLQVKAWESLGALGTIWYCHAQNFARFLMVSVVFLRRRVEPIAIADLCGQSGSLLAQTGCVLVLVFNVNVPDHHRIMCPL